MGDRRASVAIRGSDAPTQLRICIIKQGTKNAQQQQQPHQSRPATTSQAPRPPMSLHTCCEAPRPPTLLHTPAVRLWS